MFKFVFVISSLLLGSKNKKLVCNIKLVNYRMKTLKRLSSLNSILQKRFQVKDLLNCIVLLGGQCTLVAYWLQAALGTDCV